MTPSEGISIGYLAVLLVGFGLWVSYGIASHDLPLVVPNCVAFLVMAARSPSRPVSASTSI